VDREKEFENILNECLDHIISGGDVVACLAQHPEHAAELEPLLRTALETRNAAAIKSSLEFRQRAGYEFQTAIREMPSREPRRAFQWQTRWVMPLVAIIVLVVAGSGTVVAAGNSLPDSPLYQVKLATEAIQLALTPSDLGKAELYARFADRRVEEIVRMAEKGNAEQVRRIAERLDSQLIAMANLTSAGEKITQETSFGMLQVPLATAPDSAATTPTTTPGITVASAPPTAPPVAVTQVPKSSDLRTQAQQEGTDNGKGAAQKQDKQEELKTMLTEKFEENLKILQEELEKAPEWLKPALQQAIEVARRGYEQALLSLE
jgi:hypothetical protein